MIKPKWGKHRHFQFCSVLNDLLEKSRKFKIDDQSMLVLRNVTVTLTAGAGFINMINWVIEFLTGVSKIS